MKPLLLPVLIAATTTLVVAQDATPTPLPAPPAPAAPAPLPAPAPVARPLRPQPLLPAPAPMAQPIDPTTGLPVAVAAPRRFDFDFPGGTPDALIKVLSKARESAVNAIIPPELAETQLPPMRLKQVTLPQVFEALEAASRKTVTFVNGSFPGFGGGQGPRSYQQRETGFGFRTTGRDQSEDAIWYFYCERPPVPEADGPPETVRFYQLARYLDTFKVDDITTAIQTGWKLDDHPIAAAPKLTFHKETKLLIVRGTPEYLRVIDDVLKELEKGLPPSTTPRPPGSPAPVAVPAPAR